MKIYRAKFPPKKLHNASETQRLQIASVDAEISEHYLIFQLHQLVRLFLNLDTEGASWNNELGCGQPLAWQNVSKILPKILAHPKRRGNLMKRVFFDVI